MKSIALIVSCCALISCNLSDEVRQLEGGWVFYDEGFEQRVLLNDPLWIPCKIVEYGYNDSFLVASQIPTSECFNGDDTVSYRAGRTATYYWLAIYAKKSLLGPMNFDEYQVARKRYNVPVDLVLKPIY